MLDKRTLGTGYLVGTGMTMAFILIVRLFTLDTLAHTRWFETLTGLMLAISLTYAGYWIDQTDLENGRVWSITQWSASGLAILTIVSLGLLLLSRIPGSLSNGGSTLVTNIAAGGVAGVLVGTVAEFRDEQRRTAELNERNLVLNRVLRHNIRNETNVILGYAEMLADDLQDDRASQAQLIRGKAENVARLGKKARQIERALDTGRERFPVDLGEVAPKAIDTVVAEHPCLTVEQSVPEQTWVMADDMLELVLENLLENAAIHAEGDVTVRLTAEPRGSTVVLSVADDGPGIPETEMEVLDDDRETPLSHGSGLGLRLVHWLVDRYDGSIAFENLDPDGALVRIELPGATRHDERVG